MANTSGILAFAVLLIIISIIMIVAGAVMYDSTGKTAGTTSSSTNWAWWLIAGGIFLFIIGVLLAVWGYRSPVKEETRIEHYHPAPLANPYGAPVMGPYGAPIYDAHQGYLPPDASTSASAVQM